MTILKVVWNRGQKIQSFSTWYLVLLLSLAYLRSSRAQSAMDAFADNLGSTVGFRRLFP
jgi:hypothetical protein